MQIPEVQSVQASVALGQQRTRKLAESLAETNNNTKRQRQTQKQQDIYNTHLVADATGKLDFAFKEPQAIIKEKVKEDTYQQTTQNEKQQAQQQQTQGSGTI